MLDIPVESLLDVEDALVSPSNPARNNGTLDYERCARLHSHLAAYGWMAHHEKGPHELDELLRRPKYLDVERTAVIAYLNATIPSEDGGMCYFVSNLDLRVAD
ncbi:hypothetical protein TSTA_015790 [Talaromyces stipitatus ATCC 10500]|uniref:Uncharacterized protein n=1 Tax=Talaromyces stipitatus (strain ATCC 10500 / CBS 375.48 / QM 6759 / NRRL 1006) TaxID=441959 RepID=B8ME67_TALSN|nr:uncharacterized protein TSTA_015790 [Talaromyces stipitatus ATCC 10500]EED16494.1 hypothetical protein TSTA_015790 [Talaromyces stipitatus ATCC 10500]